MNDPKADPGPRQFIRATMAGNVRLIPVNDIFYFKAGMQYVLIKHKEGDVIIDESLKSLEGDLSERFIRAHRNALVAKHLISGLMKGDKNQFYVTLRGLNDKLKVSRRNLPAIRKLISDKG